MIVISPPATPMYIPQTQAIAFVSVSFQLVPVPGAPPRFAARLTLLDANNKPIVPDPGAIRAMTAAESAAYLDAPATAGDTAEQDVSRRALPYLAAAFGLKGTVQ